MEGREYLGGGQTSDVFAIGDDRVLKRFKPGNSLDTANREAANAQFAREAGLPVPTAHQVTTVNGRPAIIYDRLDGKPMRSQLTARPWTLRRNARRLAALHASVHAVRAPGLPSLRETLTQRIRETAELPPDARQRTISKLESLPEGNALCHGDFHPENVLHTAAGPGIIDWLDAGSGPPAADVARTNVILKYAGGREGWFSSVGLRFFRWWYLQQRCNRTDVSRREIREWELPIAVARLTETASETTQLRAFIDSRLAEE